MPVLSKLSTPPQPKEASVSLDKLRGVDLSSSPLNVSKSRSPYAVNIMPDVDGSTVKRFGYHKIKTFTGRVNGHYILKTPSVAKELYHIGTKLYADDVEIKTGLKDNYSSGLQMSSKLWIFDGVDYLVYGEFDNPAYTEGGTEPQKVYAVKSVSEIACVPKVTISRSPTGGGKQYLPINYLSNKRTDSFLGEATTKIYQLSTKDLDATPVTAKKRNSDGTWTDLAETTAFTVDRVLGKVTFTTAPGAPPVSGEDNVEITYGKTGQAERINKCNICIAYGISGASDRVFCTGNPDYPNQDYYSQINDPTYFGDLWYSSLGQDNSPIVGYSIVYDNLAAHKATGENGRNIIMRYGTLADGNATFPITTSLQGEGTISSHAFGYLQSEPLFLTSNGIYAITSQDITGEKYSQNRSFYINKQLNSLSGRENAYSVVYKDWYLLSVGGKVYLLDGNKKNYEQNAPQSQFQYDCYVWDNVPARMLFVNGEKLCFGDDLGNVYEFYDSSALDPYKDGDTPVKLVWTSPLLTLGSISQYKTVTGVWVIGQPYNRSGGDVYYITNKNTSEFKKHYDIDVFNWDDIDFNRFSFNVSTSPQVQPVKSKAKKISTFQVQIKNERAEPFGIAEIQINYKVGGKVKQ